MKSIRIGNDIRIEWPMVLSGDVSQLKELDLSVEVYPSRRGTPAECYADIFERQSPAKPTIRMETVTIMGNGGFMAIPKRPHRVQLPFYVEDNTLVAIWTADKQFAVGDYDIRLYSRKNDGGQGVVDQCRFVRLVAHTAQADAPAASGVEAVIAMQPVTLELSGLSAYEVAVVEGFKGTREEWLESLKASDADVDLSDYVKKDNLKTINGVSLLGNGNIVITDTSTDGSATTIDLSQYATKEELKEVNDALSSVSDGVSGKQDKLVSGTNIKTINGKTLLGSGNITIESGSGSSDVDLSGYATTEEMNEALAKKQDKLVSGTSIKTINGVSILGSGNIVIESSGGDSSGDGSGGTTTVVSDTFDTEVDDDVLTTAAVGNIAKGTSCSDLKGKTFTELFEKALFSELYPSPNYQHTISLETLESPVESGTAITNPVMTAVWNDNITPSSGTGSITSVLTAKVNDIAVDISSGAYTLTGFNTIIYTMTYSYSSGTYKVTSNYGNTKTVTVAAATGKTKTVSVTSTYPWYINDEKQDSLVALTGTKTVEVELDGQPSIKVPGGNSVVTVQVDLGFGYMDVDWESGTENINDIDYVTLTKPDSYTTSCKHKITITVKK